MLAEVVLAETNIKAKPYNNPGNVWQRGPGEGDDDVQEYKLAKEMRKMFKQ